MRSNRSISGGVPTWVLVLGCVALSACLNPIPDDFPNRGGDSSDDERPSSGEPVVGSPEPGYSDADGEAPAAPGAGAGVPPEGEASAPPAADAGAPVDAGAEGGTLGSP